MYPAGSRLLRLAVSLGVSSSLVLLLYTTRYGHLLNLYDVANNDLGIHTTTVATVLDIHWIQCSCFSGQRIYELFVTIR